MPFADASPARVREALTGEDRETFDQQRRSLMARATERLDLTEVHEALEGWRRVAWVTSAYGPEVYSSNSPGSGLLISRSSRDSATTAAPLTPTVSDAATALGVDGMRRPRRPS